MYDSIYGLFTIQYAVHWTKKKNEDYDISDSRYGMIWTEASVGMVHWIVWRLFYL